MASLLIVNTHKKDDGLRVFDFQRDKPIFIGRVEGCDITLVSRAVSRQHAVLIERNGVYGIKDLDSSNGTFVNGKRLVGSRKLRSGDIVQIGEFVLKFQHDNADATMIMPMPDVVANASRANEIIPETAAPAAYDTRELPIPPTPPAPVGPASVMNPFQPKVKHITRTPDAAEWTPAPAEPESVEPESAEPESAEPESAEPESVEPAASPPPAAGIPAPADLAEEPDRIGAVDTPEPERTDTDTPILAETDDDDAEDVPEETEPALAESGKTELLDEEEEPASEDAAALFADDESEGEIDEAGDGAAPAADMDEDESEDEVTAAKAVAVSKAAAEAGLVGEFTPETEEGAVVAGEREDIGDRVPMTETLASAIETRLMLYSFLSDLIQERVAFLEKYPDAAEGVKSELARQDREIGKMPGAEQARGMIEKRQARRKALADKIAEARKNGEKPPPKPSKQMVAAEEFADSQWNFIIQSEEEAVPAVIDEAYRLGRDEPVVELLEGKGIDVRRLVGGGVYLLALEGLLEDTQKRRQDMRAQLAAAAQSGKKGGFRLFGRDADDDDDDDDDQEAAGPDADDLAAEDQELADRASWITQEMASLEKKLIAEFWRVYTEAALAYIAVSEPLPWPIRAYLRHGAIGFKPWWMSAAIREHVMDDCRSDTRDREAREGAETNLVYVDEYLEAVLSGECTPALDENLELNERNSPNWKADKALRRLIYSRQQEKRLTGLLDTFETRLADLRMQTEEYDEKMAKILPGSKMGKQNKREMQQKQQGVRVEITKVARIRDKIRDETLGQLREAIADTEARFESGELPRPTPEFLIRRECGAVHRIARLLANLKERFLPMVVREYKLGSDAINDRVSISGEIAYMESRDPALFLETIVPAKKRKDRVDLRISPTIVIVPSPGLLCYAWNPRGGQENGRLAIPTCFIRPRLRERQITYLMSDFRWDTSKASAGMDILTSDTIVAAFMGVRWDWRKRSRDAREKGLIFNDQNDRTNWRRVYESYIQTALDGGKKLYNRNYDFYERIIGKYFYLPEGVELLKK